MPAAYVGLATAATGLASNLAGGGSSGGSGGGSPGGGWGSALAGGVYSAANPPRAQVNPGGYSPPSNIGEGYNYIPQNQGGIDALVSGLLQNAGSGGGANPYLDFNTLFQQSGVGGMGPLQEQIQGLRQTANYDVNNASPQLFKGAQQIYDLGFDPQQQLYDRTTQRLQDQIRAGNAAAGIGSTPYGAGVEAQGMKDFNIDWNNQQLQRALQGVGGAAGAYQASSNLGQTGAGLYGQGGLLPALTYEQFQAMQQQRNLAPVNPGISYLTGAQGANRLANQVAMGQAELVGNQNANAAAGLGNALDSLPGNLSSLYKSIFGDSSGSSGGGADPNMMNYGGGDSSQEYGYF